MDTTNEAFFDDDPVIFLCYRATCKGSAPAEQFCWTSVANVTACDPDELLCTAGAHAPLCGACQAPDFYFDPSTKTCLECGTSPLALSVQNKVALGIVAALAVVVLIVMYKTKAPLPAIVAVPLGTLRHLDAGSMKVVLSTYQIVQSIYFSLGGKSDRGWRYLG